MTLTTPMNRATPSDEHNRPITVCSACLCAGCWHGHFECEDSPFAATTRLTVGELDRLGREHPSQYLAQRER